MIVNPAIVVVAYNRERSLARLLESLAKAHYPNSEIQLIISIDYSLSNHQILEMADEFIWSFGKKTVVYQDTNLGLRNHILKCGELSYKYGSIIILEDDLFVSPNFYNYSKSALEFCVSDKRIGGISLYNHQLNVHNKQNFSPLEDGFDNWYFQFASSWGQAWTSEQWQDFIKWYNFNKNIDNDVNIPAYVRRWSEKSWLKYFIAYLVQNKMYFFYPRISLTTNYNDAGTHIGNDSTRFQVPILNNVKMDYTFSKIEESKSVYDSFYENILIPNIIGLDNENTTIDLFGTKQGFERYLITTKILNFKIIKSFSKSLKPIEANVICSTSGNEIFLYDTNDVVKNNIKRNVFRDIIYNHKHISPKNAIWVIWNFIYQKLKKILRKFNIKLR